MTHMDAETMERFSRRRHFGHEQSPPCRRQGGLSHRLDRTDDVCPGSVSRVPSHAPSNPFLDAGAGSSWTSDTRALWSVAPAGSWRVWRDTSHSGNCWLRVPARPSPSPTAIYQKDGVLCTGCAIIADSHTVAIIIPKLQHSSGSSLFRLCVPLRMHLHGQATWSSWENSQPPDWYAPTVLV